MGGDLFFQSPHIYGDFKNVPILHWDKIHGPTKIFVKKGRVPHYEQQTAHRSELMAGIRAIQACILTLRELNLGFPHPKQGSNPCVLTK